jgi:two-component system, OmpR family, sensor histidine kinase ChvG
VSKFIVKAWRYSPLTARILAVNILALLMLGGGMLYLGRYQESLTQAELESLAYEARIFAGALGEGAVLENDEGHDVLAPELARSMVRRLIEISESRTRLYDTDGDLLADSRRLKGRGGTIEIDHLSPPLSMLDKPATLWQKVTGWLNGFFAHARHPTYPAPDKNDHDMLAMQALQGGANNGVWRQDGELVLVASVPVQAYKQALGALVVTRAMTRIDTALVAVRGDVLKIFLAVLTLTILVSLYLARTIVKPLQKLAHAVRAVKQDQTQAKELGGAAAQLARRQIPDLTNRHDELGDLSHALREMTQALAARLEAIERFAADVAHELKNPLTSLRSAIETADRVKDPELLNRLLMVIKDDVDRMNRLITDIADASRLDAELGRAAITPIGLRSMLEMIVNLYKPMDTEQGAVRVVLVQPIPEDWVIYGVQDRLTQVLRNLIENALSFSAADASVRIYTAKTEKAYVITIDDEGCGIPPTKLETIFERFYSERPRTEKFGQHSGLGLSIARQIIEAHQGTIRAENRHDATGTIIGARFIVTLPWNG